MIDIILKIIQVCFPIFIAIYEIIENHQIWKHSKPNEAIMDYLSAASNIANKVYRFKDSTYNNYLTQVRLIVKDDSKINQFENDSSLENYQILFASLKKYTKY